MLYALNHSLFIAYKRHYMLSPRDPDAGQRTPAQLRRHQP